MEKLSSVKVKMPEELIKSLDLLVSNNTAFAENEDSTAVFFSRSHHRGTNEEND